MPDLTFAWLLFGVYAAITAGLAWKGARRTKTMTSFAIGNRDMGPGLVGLTLAASMASTATFVINPGFVYQYGLSALIAFTAPMIAGMFLGLVLLSRRFREVGDRVGALTLPHWMGQRFGSRGMSVYFAFITLLNLFYIVLIVVGSAYMMSATLGLSYRASVMIVVGFVFAYTMFGGSYAHAYTNGFQGGLMAIIAVLLLASGFFVIDGGVLDRIMALGESEPYFLSVTNPASPFFQGPFEVFICAFVMGFAVVTQPHLMTKALYLRSTKDIRRFVAVGGGAFVLYSGVYFAGLYARVLYPNIANQDTVMAVYLSEVFPAKISILVSVVVLAAAMSTLDGILVAVSTTVSNDLFRPWINASSLGASPERVERMTLWASRIAVVVLGVVALIIALSPPELVGIFGSVGVYGILAASAAPLVAGVYMRHIPSSFVWVAATVGPTTHFVLYFLEVSANPAVTATLGIGASALPLLLWAAVSRFVNGLDHEPAEQECEL